METERPGEDGEDDAEDHVSETESYHPAFENVFKSATYRFTEKEKKGKLEAVKLLNIKRKTQDLARADDEKVNSEDAGMAAGDNTKSTMKYQTPEQHSIQTLETHEIYYQPEALHTAGDFTQKAAADRPPQQKRSREIKTKLTLGTPGLNSFSIGECSLDISVAELLPSQEKTQLQGSPLKKFFTGTGLKKLSGKKHKGEREESKSEEQVEAIQHLPEQTGSPSKGGRISTWKSFKKLITPRKGSKSRMEEKTGDAVVGSSLEHSKSDSEPGKDESWVSFRKLMPGRRKKKSDGKPEPTHLKQAREDMAETMEEDSDTPAVVALPEYEAAEQEKTEAQQVKDFEAMTEETSEEDRKKLPVTETAVEETREECLPAGQTAAPDKTEDETSSLGLTAGHPVQPEGEAKTLTFLQAEGLEALKVPVAAAAVEEQVVAETVTPADTTAQTVQPLATAPEEMASEEVPVTAVDSSGCGTAEPGRAQAPKPQVTPASMNGVSEEQESPQSSGQPEQNGIPLSDSLSLTHAEFEQYVVQPLTKALQVRKSLLKAIQTAVHKLAETEESAAFDSEQHVKSIGVCGPSATDRAETLEDAQVDHQLPVREEGIQSKVENLQQSGLVQTATLTVSAEIHATAGNTKDTLLTPEVLEDGQSLNSLTIVTPPEDVSRESVRLQKSMLEQSASEDSTKDPLQPPILREREVGQIMEIPDQHTVCQRGQYSETLKKYTVIMETERPGEDGEDDAEDHVSETESYHPAFENVFKSATYRFTEKEKKGKLEAVKLLNIKRKTQDLARADDEKVNSEDTGMAAGDNTKSTMKYQTPEQHSIQTLETHEIYYQPEALHTAGDFTQKAAAERPPQQKRSREIKTKLTLGTPGLNSFSIGECSLDISVAELLPSQEKTQLQGSPLKKFFTGTGLKKLSGKKHKGEREESKSEEQVEAIQHLPEQTGSPSKGGRISTWKSFKKLITPRKGSKSRMEEKTGDAVVGSSLEHSKSDSEPGKDESCVSFRKLMPGRRKKKSDGKPEPTHLKQAREDMAETMEEDSDTLAVVALPEYEAAEQEKTEAQQVKDFEAMTEETSEEDRKKLPVTETAVEETREECLPAGQTAVPDKTEDETSSLGLNSLTIVTPPEDVSRESVRLQKSMLEQSASEHSTKDPLQPPLLREREVGQIMEIPDQHTGQQTCRESEKERHHLPLEDGKPQNWEDGSCRDGTSCDSPQSQNSVAPNVQAFLLSVFYFFFFFNFLSFLVW